MSKMCLFVDVYDINTDLGRWMMVKGIKGSMLKEHEKEQEGLDFQHWNPVWSFNCNMVGLNTLVPKIMTIWTMLLYFETPEKSYAPFSELSPNWHNFTRNYPLWVALVALFNFGWFIYFVLN